MEKNTRLKIMHCISRCFWSKKAWFSVFTYLTFHSKFAEEEVWPSGRESVAEIEDARASPSQTGQDRHRLSEAARRVLQVANKALHVQNGGALLWGKGENRIKIGIGEVRDCICRSKKRWWETRSRESCQTSCELRWGCPSAWTPTNSPLPGLSPCRDTDLLQAIPRSRLV